MTSVGAPAEDEATVIAGYLNARQLAAEGEVVLSDLGRLIETFWQVRRPGSAALLGFPEKRLIATAQWK